MPLNIFLRSESGVWFDASLTALGMTPMSSSNGEIFIVCDGQELIVYCAIGSYLAQSFCCLLQNIHG